MEKLRLRDLTCPKQKIVDEKVGVQTLEIWLQNELTATLHLLEDLYTKHTPCLHGQEN